MFRLPLRRSVRQLGRNTTPQIPQQSQRTLVSHGLAGRLCVYPPVAQALAAQRPVVALESTILSHGLPYPENVELAQSLATLLRAEGVEPATIALGSGGQCHVGLSPAQIADLCQARERAVKCSTRDIPLFLARNAALPGNPADYQWGATTVASTMRIAHAAGIATFVTGGIGGVHRDGENSMDVSADLLELGKTPVIVVSAGIKSILDIRRTLEVLETNGVPCMSYQTDEFPAFFSPHSGVKSPARVDDPSTIAVAYNVGLETGMLVAVPNHDPAGATVEAAIQAALEEATVQNITGQAVTPYILKRVAELTQGDSLRSNVALVHQNAKVGAAIARALARERQKMAQSTIPVAAKSSAPQQSTARSQVVVVGGIVLDLVARPLGPELIPKTSNPATCLESDGGVGRNVAEVLGRLGSQPLLYSAVGRDARGLAILDRLESEYGVPAARETVRVVDRGRTATYLAVLDGEGDMHVACADMEILQRIPTPPDDVLKASAMLVVDGNPPIDTIREVVTRARMFGVEVFFEPTSVPKALKVAKHGDIMACLTHMSPNTDELLAMAKFKKSVKSQDEVTLLQTEPGLTTIRNLAKILLDRMDPQQAHIVVTMGAQGALLVSRFNDDEPTAQYFPAYEGVVVRNATGAGDSFTGAVVHSLLQKNRMAAAVEAGMRAAVASLECADSAIATDLGIPPV